MRKFTIAFVWEDHCKFIVEVQELSRAKMIESLREFSAVRLTTCGNAYLATRPLLEVSPLAAQVGAIKKLGPSNSLNNPGVAQHATTDR
jgi:hypothetical protein